MTVTIEKSSQPVVLTIAGHDPSGGAGIVADIKTISAFGCYAAVAITSLTFQNTTGVFGSVDQNAETVGKQIEAVLDDLPVAAIKTGMLPSSEVIEEVARLVAERALPAPVVDPVVRSTSDFDLIDENALQALIKTLFPLAQLITPNIPEAERISGITIEGESGIFEAARKIQQLGARNVLIKGGHGEHEFATDILFEGGEATYFRGPWIDTGATHGTGCTLSAAIAANLALGRGLKESVAIAKKFVTEAIRTSPQLGSGSSPINQLIHPK
jgi:hydroxymethylpyrimidine kinase/phosphomethylpyrimidine kinase